MAMTAALLALTGCEGLVDVASHPVVAGTAAINAVSVVTTDKSIPDHVVGLLTGHDCSVVRYSTGGYYCVRPLPANSAVETRLFCYNSIGAITCYDEPIPGEDGRLVSDPRHVLSSRDIAGPMVGPMPGQR
jgi:hypothetical protein